MFDILYKRTNAGKIQQWTVEVEGNKFRSISGQTDGVKTTASWTVCEGKNIGRANETTPEEQAVLEAQAKFTKKLDGHYHRDIKNADVAKFPKAMLAHKFDKRKDDVPVDVDRRVKNKGGYYKPENFDDVYSQPKLDGMRCLVPSNGMFSRGGKPILSAPHVYNAVRGLFDADLLATIIDIEPALSGITLDGELYASHLRDDFEKLISLAKKAKPKPEDIEESAANLQYWVYDFAGSDLTFEQRTELLKQAVQMINDPAIVYTPTEKVRDQEHMDFLYQKYLEAGQEGQMIRRGNSKYEGKRSKHLLKRKEFVDEEFVIVSLNEGQGNYAGMIKSVTIRNNNEMPDRNGEIRGTFDSGIKGNQDYLKSLMDNPEQHIGSEATVRYQNRSVYHVPRFPVVVHIWDGKRDV